MFRNKRADRLKLLYWDADGYALWYKRLEKGSFCFRFPVVEPAATRIDITATDLTMLLAGIDLASVQRQNRFRLTPENNSVKSFV